MNKRYILTVYLATVLGLSALAQTDSDTQFGPPQTITYTGNDDIYTADLDGDGDQDVLSAEIDLHKSEYSIAWYENDGEGNFKNQRIVAPQTYIGADTASWAIYAADLDQDGDQDVLLASYTDDKIAWYENDGKGNFSEQQVISNQANGALYVYAADLDQDGDQDVLSASYNDNKIAWYENDGQGNFGEQQIITVQAKGARNLYTIDLDQDGDQDVLSASSSYPEYTDRGDGYILSGDAKIAWYENDGEGNFGEQQIISTEVGGAEYVYAADLDQDGNLDILARGVFSTVWYKNDGQGNFGSPQVIGLVYSSNDAAPIVDSYPTDLDNDGDIDLISSLAIFIRGLTFLPDISWYENDGQGNFKLKERIFGEDVLAAPQNLYASDLDQDGDQDVLAGFRSFDGPSGIIWFENSSNLDVPTVAAFELVNSQTDEGIQLLEDTNELGLPYDLFYLGEPFTVRALTFSGGKRIRRIEFRLDPPVGKNIVRSEYAEPYSLFSDNKGDYFGRRAYVGTYQLTATPYYLDSTGKEAAGKGKSISFRFVNDGFPLVNSFTLVNNNTDEDVQLLEDGDRINLSNLDLRTFTVRADVAPARERTRRVAFQLSAPAGQPDVRRSEYAAPYSLFSDSRGDYFGQKVYEGEYILTATPYYLVDTFEVAGLASTIRFTFTGGEPSVVNSFTLVNNNTDEDIQTLEDGDEVSLEDITTFTVRANVLPRQQRVRRVEFRLDAPAGQQGALRSEYAAPYSLFSDNRGDYFGRKAYAGEYKLTVTPYYVNSAGKEIAGANRSIRFTFTDSQASLAASAGMAYPVPFNETLTLELGAVDMSQTQIQLVHGYGKVYEVQTSQMSQDAQGLVLNLAKLPSGPYTVRVMNQGKVQTFRVSKE